MKNYFKIFPVICFFVIGILAVIGGSLFTAGSFAFANEIVEYDEDQNFIDYKAVVKGREEGLFKAEKANINAQLQTLDFNKNVSEEKNERSINNILRILEDEKITGDKVEISFYSTYPMQSNNQSYIGYITNTSFSFQVENLERLKEIIDKVSEEGATINSINYSIKDYQQKYNDLLILATENAKAKAKKLLNKEDINIVKIKEECNYYCNSKYQFYYDSAVSELDIPYVTINAEVEIIAY